MNGHDRLVELLTSGDQLVRITVAEARGSTPREIGAWMLVSEATQEGTIGGGRLEMMAIEEGRRLLASGKERTSLDVPLGPEIGQCCGGRVSLELVRVDEGERKTLVARTRHESDALPRVLIFGAGHVGKALAASFALLPVRTTLIETRRDELDAAPDTAEKILSAVPESVIDTAPPGSAYVVLTHDHALDFVIVEKALSRTDATYVGMIGSKTKRARFHSWLVEQSGSGVDDRRLSCPIGGSGLCDKRPQVIAALTAAEIMTALAERSTEPSTSA